MEVPVPPPGYAPLRALPSLQAPVWGLQPSEPPNAVQAFVAWLGKGPRGDYHGAERATGYPRQVLEALAQEWAWDVRAREYWQHLRQLAYDAAAPLREQLQAQRARTHQISLDLEELELRKLYNRARGIQGEGPESLPEQLDMRTLARLRQVNASVSEQLRREAEGIAPNPTSAGDDDGIAWDKLSDVEAEAYRELRSKAGLG